MKNLIYLLTCFLLIACNEPKQRSAFKTSVPTDSEAKISNIHLPVDIAEIKTTYISTMQKLQNNKLDSIVVKYNSNEEKSGTITYYTEHGSLKLLKHAYSEYDHHEAIDQYFVQDSTLYFATYKRISWSFVSNAVEGATKDDVTESRFYFINNKPIRCLEKKYSIYSASPNKVVPEKVANQNIDCRSANLTLSAFRNLIAFDKH